MKKLLLLLFNICLFTNIIFADTTIATYITSGVKKTIEVSSPKKNNYKIYIHSFGNDIDNDETLACFKSKDLPKVIESLNNIKNKFIEWDSLSRKNNITNYSKKINFGISNLDFYWYWVDTWYCGKIIKYGIFSSSYYMPLKYIFIVDENGKSYIYTRCKIISISNRYISTYFTSLLTLDELNKLISILEDIPNLVSNKFKSLEKTEQIFK